MTRREFIKAVGAAAVAALMPHEDFASEGQRLHYGVQLHGIRGVCAKDLRGTLAAIRAMGFEGVEAGNFFGLEPKAFGAAVREAGLELVALQLYPYFLTEPQIADAIRLCRETGAKRLNAAWFKGSAENKADWQLAVNVLNHAAEVFAREGLSLGYHNHDQEFRIRLEGVTAMEWMMSRLSSKVALEFDPGWAALAGADPLAFLAAHPNLGPDAHLTPAIPDARDDVPPGQGGLGAAQDRADWRRIIPALAASGVEWAFVKPLAHPDSLADLEASRKWLEKNWHNNKQQSAKAEKGKAKL